MTLLITVGYSGSRNGMTDAQVLGVYWHLNQILLENDIDDPLVELHHGDCLGGDAQAHVIATVLRCRRVAHPPSDSRLRAWCAADEIREPKDYLARDWDIASETAELIAAPQHPEPDPHSGTWTTIGYAVRLGRPVTVFLPDGTQAAGCVFFGAPLPAVPGDAA